MIDRILGYKTRPNYIINDPRKSDYQRLVLIKKLWTIKSVYILESLKLSNLILESFFAVKKVFWTLCFLKS